MPPNAHTKSRHVRGRRRPLCTESKKMKFTKWFRVFNTNNRYIHVRLMLEMNQYIYHIVDLLQMNDMCIRLYLANNLFVLNHTDDNHKLWISETTINRSKNEKRNSYEYNPYYYVLIYEKIPSIHFHNVNNWYRRQLVDNNKNSSLDHRIIAKNLLGDNYNILVFREKNIQLIRLIYDFFYDVTWTSTTIYTRWNGNIILTTSIRRIRTTWTNW